MYVYVKQAAGFTWQCEEGSKGAHNAAQALRHGVTDAAGRTLHR